MIFKLATSLKYIILLFLINQNSYSQTTIKGQLIDENKKTIISANVILKDITGNIISFTHSDEYGNYEMKTTKTGNFNLIVNSMGYEQKSEEITIEKSSDIKKIIFTLISKPTEIKEIIITSTKPITVKKDTIIFDAKSFSTGNEQVVEDLLKKIPGLNIDSEGKIKVGNQEIEKIMIEGDDFFEKGYKILTKNMPANSIDKVELYQKYSNNKHLKGIENSQKVALNLTLKEDYKHQWFGNASLGYGLMSENRYEIRSNLINLGKKAKYYFLTNFNNLGYNATGDINNLIRPYRENEIGNVGDDKSAYTLIRLGTDLPNLREKRIHFNNAEMISLNNIFPISKKVKLKTLGFLNTDENDFYKNSFQSFLVGNNSFTNNEDFKVRKTSATGFGKIDLIYDISKTKTFEYVTKYNSTNEKNKSNLVFNNNILNENLGNNNQLFDQKLVFTNKFKENKVFVLSIRYINEKNPQNYNANQFIFNDLFIENANNTKQFSQNKMQFIGLEAHVLDRKKNGNLLELKISNQLRIDNLKTQFQLLNNNNSLSFPTNYQNNADFISNNLCLSTKYHLKLGRYTLATQSDFHQLYNQYDNFKTKIKQNPFFIIPKIGINFKINKKNTILTSYSYNTTNANILDIYSGYVQIGFRSLSKGVNNVNQLNSSNAILNYSFGSWGDNFFANTYVLYSKDNNFYSTNNFISQNYSLTENILINDREALSIASNIDRYFKPIRSNLKISLSGTKTNFKNIVNNSNFREIINLGTEFGLEIRSGFKGAFNYHIGSKWNYNQVEATIKNSFTNNTSFFDLSFTFTDKFNMQFQSERYYFGNLDNKNNQYYFLDIETRYVVKENKLTFSLSGNNLFNTKTFRNYSISDISISKTEYRLQPRYLLLKIEFRF
jgi:hypothetical protein